MEIALKTCLFLVSVSYAPISDDSVKCWLGSESWICTSDGLDFMLYYVFPVGL